MAQSLKGDSDLSAYIVNHSHIDALLSYAIKHNVCYVVRETNALIEITARNASEIGRILLDENERSVRHRYADSDDVPGTIGEEGASYKFRNWPVLPEALIILKACDCFDYQACETDDYDTTLANRIITAIRKKAIIYLPGWSDAPGWNLDRPTIGRGRRA
jgi:hypothetical protein